VPVLKTFTLGGRPVGGDARPLLIGEVGQAHDGSLGLAHAFVDVIADAGADAVKFQTHIAEAESTPSEPFRVPFSRQDASRYDYWRRTAFDEEQWAGLAAHAGARDVLFLSSPFSLEAVDLLTRIGVPGWKIGSGEVSNGPLLDRVARTALPVLLSSGMSGYDELDGAAERLRGSAFAVLQCTSAYPAPPEQLGLNVLEELRARYGAPVGLSDHSGTIFPSLAAVSLGARVVEVHVTLSREMFGPDVPASVTSAEFRELCAGVRFIAAALEHPVDKDAAAGGMGEMRRLFTRSLVTTRALEAGAVLEDGDLASRKPGTGIPATDRPRVLGRRVARAVDPGTLLSEADLEPENGAAASSGG
jgi:N-acetylneuraminate synthase